MNNPFASLTGIPIDALAKAVWLERIGCDVVRRFWKSNILGHREPKISHRSRQDCHLQHMVAAGFGVMFSPEHAPHLPSLVARPIEGDPLRRHVQLLVVSGRQYTPALDAFVKISRLHDWGADIQAPRTPAVKMNAGANPTEGCPRADVLH
jgi:LysR substrate binding domain